PFRNQLDHVLDGPSRTTTVEGVLNVPLAEDSARDLSFSVGEHPSPPHGVDPLPIPSYLVNVEEFEAVCRITLVMIPIGDPLEECVPPQVLDRALRDLGDSVCEHVPEGVPPMILTGDPAPLLLNLFPVELSRAVGKPSLGMVLSGDPDVLVESGANFGGADRQ